MVQIGSVTAEILLSSLLRVGGWPAGWVGAVSENGNKAISASIEVEVEVELS